MNRQEIEVQNLRRAFDIVSPPLPAETKTDWCVLWESARPLDESPENALSYLQHRAISLEVAVKNGVSFIASWHGRGTLCFPFKDQNGEVVAIAGRALRNGGMDKPASGPKKLGAFWASALGFGALDAALPAIIVCEAPFDALSLAQAGFPALAIGGTSPPVWLPSKCAFRRVLLAFDADDAGDNAASKIGAMLASFGATGARLRPQGAKDWNEWLQKDGVEAIQNAVDPFVCD